ncbi:protein of unknown function [Streptococcus thermophilus]|nr:protein of unknown function [Streptococcus thermophilus]
MFLYSCNTSFRIICKSYFAKKCIPKTFKLETKPTSYLRVTPILTKVKLVYLKLIDFLVIPQIFMRICFSKCQGFSINHPDIMVF